MPASVARGGDDPVTPKLAPRVVAALTHLAFAACVLLSAASAQAAHIAVLRPSAATPELSEAVFRIQGELLALGLEVELAERPPNSAAGALDSRAFLERMASERGIDAAVDVVGDTTPTAVDIWIFERSPRRSEVSRVMLEPTAHNAAETLAIHAIEVLRSNFVEIDLAARARLDGGVRGPRAEPPAPPPKDPQILALEAGGAVLTSLDGVGPAVLPLARFRWAFGSGFVAQATLAGLGTRPTIETATASAKVAQHYGVLGLGYGFPAHSGVAPFGAFRLARCKPRSRGEPTHPSRAIPCSAGRSFWS